MPKQQQGQDQRTTKPDVAKCVNPECERQFLKLGQGCLSVFPVQDAAAWGLPGHVKQKVVWICEDCSRTYYVRLDRRNHAVQLVHRTQRRAA